MADPKDNLLVQKTLKGDTESFRLLVERYQNPLLNLAYRLTGSRECAEDLAQEAFVRAYEHLERFDQKRSFFTWLYTICTNLTINELKKRKYGQCERRGSDRKADIEGLTDDHRPNGGLNECEQRIEAKKGEDLLNDLLGRISDEYRTAVILRYQEELSYQEMAQILGISVSLAKVRVHRGIEKMRKLYQKMENMA